MMKLYLNKASPYARLVMAVAHEKALAERLELVWTDPWVSEERLLAVTPLARVPVLVADDREPLVESACICDFLDRIGSGPALVPWDGRARLTVLRKCGLGRGLIDVAFGAVIQQRYAAGAEPLLRERWRKAVERTIAVLDRTETLGTAPDLGDLTIAVALSYIDFRMREVDWRARAPRLRDWYPLIECRKSMKESAPQ